MSVTLQTLFPVDVTASNPGRARRSDPDTSKAAGKNAICIIRWGSQRHTLLKAYADIGPSTDEQVGLRSGIRRVADTRRCSELRSAGLIEPTGETHPTSTGAMAMKCRITTEGLRTLMATRKVER